MTDERIKPEKIDIDYTEDFKNKKAFPEPDEAGFREVKTDAYVNEEYLSQFWERCKDIPIQNAYNELKTKNKKIIDAINELKTTTPTATPTEVTSNIDDIQVNDKSVVVDKTVKFKTITIIGWTDDAANTATSYNFLSI